MVFVDVVLCPTFVPKMQHFLIELVHPKAAKNSHLTENRFVHALELFEKTVLNLVICNDDWNELVYKIYLLPELCEYTELWPTQTNDQLGNVGSNPGGLNACTMPLRYSVVDGCR